MSADQLHTQFPFNPHFLDVDGGRLHYLDEGPREAPTIFCLHGFPAWSFLFRQPLQLLRERWRLVALDFPGFGGSDPVGLTAAEAMLRLADHLQIERAGLLAHGCGSQIASTLARTDSQRFPAICLSAPWAGPVSEQLAWGRWLFQAQRQGLLSHYLMDLPMLLPGMMLRMGCGPHFQFTATRLSGYGAPAEQTARSGHALDWLRRHHLASPGTPPPPCDTVAALIIHGTLDQVQAATRSQQHLGRQFPQHRCVQLPGVGHWLPEEASDVLASLADSFFSEQLTGASSQLSGRS